MRLFISVGSLDLPTTVDASLGCYLDAYTVTQLLGRAVCRYAVTACPGALPPTIRHSTRALASSRSLADSHSSLLDQPRGRARTGDDVSKLRSYYDRRHPTRCMMGRLVALRSQIRCVPVVQADLISYDTTLRQTNTH